MRSPMQTVESARETDPMEADKEDEEVRIWGSWFYGLSRSCIKHISTVDMSTCSRNDTNGQHISTVVISTRLRNDTNGTILYVSTVVMSAC